LEWGEPTRFILSQVGSWRRPKFLLYALLRLGGYAKGGGKKKRKGGGSGRFALWSYLFLSREGRQENSKTGEAISGASAMMPTKRKRKEREGGGGGGGCDELILQLLFDDLVVGPAMGAKRIGVAGKEGEEKEKKPQPKPHPTPMRHRNRGGRERKEKRRGVKAYLLHPSRSTNAAGESRWMAVR